MAFDRNPFRMQTSEQIESETHFLKLFEPAAISLLPPSCFENRVSSIRSSQGGGKTSLLRLFTPVSLQNLQAHKSSEDYQELYGSLKGLGVINDNGPQLLGILLNCGRDFDSLETLDLDAKWRKRMFFSLLDARLILAGLRSIIEVEKNRFPDKKIEYPDSVESIRFSIPPEISIPKEISNNCTGKDLFEWAKKLEIGVFKIIDSFGKPEMNDVQGHDTVYAASILNSQYVSIDGNNVDLKTLIMLDDCHKLTRNQREALDSIVSHRHPVTLWIAERLEVLDEGEFYEEGILWRDWIKINLEEAWSSGKNRFEKSVIRIADRRVQFSNFSDIQSFSALLQDSLEGTKWQKRLEEATSTLVGRLQTIAEEHREYSVLPQLDDASKSPLDRVILLKSIEILVNRDINKSQKTLQEFIPQPMPRFNRNILLSIDSSIMSAAELQLCHEFKLPYYYGIDRITQMASANIEQFLMIGGDLFEEAVMARLANQGYRLSPEHQEKIIKKGVESRWSSIPQKVKHSEQVQKILTGIGNDANVETMRSNAPYAPGVTGVGIRMREISRFRRSPTEYKSLRLSLLECLQHRYLDAKTHVRQGGDEWVVFYINRYYCAHFGLPLGYGGWRPRTLKTLSEYLERSLKPIASGRKTK